MKKLKHIFLYLITILAASNIAYAKDKKISVGIMNGDSVPVFEKAAEIAKEKYGIEVKLVKFDDYVLPNEALSRGSLDANAFQHVPYLERQSKDRGYKLAVLGNTFVWPISAYSNKIKNLSELKNGDKISLPNDPTNQGRALLLLQSEGLIKIDPKAGLAAGLAHIISNPKRLVIQPIDAALVPKTLNSVAFAVINTNYAKINGLNPEDAIFTEDKNSPYVNVIVAREDNKDDIDVLNFVKSFQTLEVWRLAERIFGSAVVKGW